MTTTSKKNKKTLAEDAKGSSVALIEDVFYPTSPLQLEARGAEGGPKKWLLKGEFGRVDKATENKRLYPKSVMESQFKKLSEGMDKRRVYGHLDHPADGRTSLNHVSHIITKLEVQPDGSVYGEAEILPTASGNNLKALAESKCGIGFSSRGFGTTKPGTAGEDVVQEDYRLVTYDAVADPASKDAWPSAVEEAKKLPVDESMSEAVLADAENIRLLQDKLAQSEALRAAAESRLDDVASKVVASINETKTSLEANIKERLLADPTVAGAKTALEAIVLAVRPFLPENEDVMSEKDTEIAELRKQIEALTAEKGEALANLEKMSVMARSAGYSFFLEKQLRNEPEADLIRQIVGNVSQYETVDAIAARVVAVKTELAKRAEAQAAHEAKEAARVTELQGQVTGLKEALEKSIALNKMQGLDSYIAERVRNHPKRDAILESLKTTPPADRAAVDALVDTFRVALSESDQAEDIRSRVRRLLNSQGSETGPVSEANKSGNKSPTPPSRVLDEGQKNDWNGTGLSLVDLNKLSGISN